MAKTAKRKTPAKRKPAASRPSIVGLSGWAVAAAIGAAWAGPQFGLWPSDVLDRVPTLAEIRDFASFETQISPKAAEAQRVQADTQDKSGPAAAVVPKRSTSSPLKPETIEDLVRKADAKPVTAVPKPQARVSASATPSVPIPPASVPTSVPLTSAALHKPMPVPAATSRPSELAIRRYPFTTAPAVAYVADLRTLRILGGEGDWKKVEVSATGVTGWLRLQRFGGLPSSSSSTSRSPVSGRPPVPAVPVQEASAERMR